jgi:hypothetical protein
MERGPRWGWIAGAVIASCVAFVLLAVRTGRCMSEAVGGSACETGVGPLSRYGAHIWVAIALLFVLYAIVRAFRR